MFGNLLNKQYPDFKAGSLNFPDLLKLEFWPGYIRIYLQGMVIMMLLITDNELYCICLFKR